MKDLISLMPEVLAALQSTGANVSLAQDLEAAIEADRKRRGEPVAWVKQDVVEKQFINMRPRRIWWECNDGIGMPIYAAPQPAESTELPSYKDEDDFHQNASTAELGAYQRGWNACRESTDLHPAAPTIKESLTAAEPVKVPSDAAQRVTAFIDRRKQMRGLDQSVIAGLDGESYALLTEDLLALLARYGQPTQQRVSLPIMTARELASRVAGGEKWKVDDLQVAEAFNADIPVTEQEEEEWKRLEDSK